MNNTKDLAQGNWQEILTKFGADSSCLDGKHRPCPSCGGTDRFRFDDQDGSGSHICSQCGAGDGFALVQKMCGYKDFKETAAAIDSLMDWQGEPLSNEQRQAYKAKVEKQSIERAETVIQSHTIAAASCSAIWEGGSIATDAHPYLRAKGIQSHGLRIHKDRLLVPVRIDGEISSMQYIDADGSKLFHKGGNVSGGYYPITGDERASKELVIIAEGIATGASIREATGCHTAIGFNASNLVKVAKVIRAKLPNAQIVIAGDNDQKTSMNTGLNAALEAAKAVGGMIALPAGEKGCSVDFNDLYQQQGLEIVAAAIANAVTPELLSSGKGESNEWETPEDLDTPELNAPEFTKECMPLLAWEVAANAAHVAATTTIFSIPTVLSDVTKALSGMVDVARVDGDISNLVTLFMVNIAGTGEGKSATQDCLSSRVIKEHIKNRQITEQADLATWADEQEMLKDEKKDVMKSKGENRRAKLRQLNQDITEHEQDKPRGLCTVLQSPTPEALTEQAGQYIYVMLSTDEGSQVLDSFGRYSDSSSSDMNPYLKGYDGGEVQAERRNNTRYGGVLRLGMNISVQPVIAERVLGDALMAGRGLLNRMTWLVSPTTAGSLDYSIKRKRNHVLMKQWEQMLLGLIGSIEQSTERVQLRLSNEAELLWVSYANSLQAEIRAEKLEGLNDLFHKRFPSLLLRVAAVFHVIDHGLVGSISAETMNLAINFCDVVKRHRVVLHRGFGTDNNRVKARSVLRKLADDKCVEISVSELHRKHWSEMKDIRDAEGLLQYLEDTGWARLLHQPHTKGRPKSPVYQIHPKYVKLMKGGVPKVPKVHKVPETAEITPVNESLRTLRPLRTKGNTKNEVAGKVNESGTEGRVIGMSL